MILNPFLSLKNDLIRYDGINDEACDHTNQTGKGQEDQRKLSLCQYLHKL
jgi:hypothetical protein